MTPAELAARYRGYAIRCLLFAKQQDDAGDRLILVDMAQAWATLADYADKNKPVLALFETSDAERHR